MSSARSQPGDQRALHLSAMWIVLTYALTTIHHVYSSFLYAPDATISGIFSGSWRGHGFLVFLIPLLLALAALFFYEKSRRRGWLRVYALINGVVFIVVVGLWEGGWNHLAKLVFFLAGAEQGYAYGPATLLQFPAVVPPEDVFFEATGVLTLLFGITNAWYLWKLGRRPQLP